MTAFEFFSVAFSFVLGLGVTRLLLAVVHVFRSRDEQKLHWIPLTWALSIFIYQIQFWWAIFELNELIGSWSHGRFISVLVLALLLFVAGTLILPSNDSDDREQLFDYFDKDGRYALLALTAYSLLAQWANWYLFNTPLFSFVGALVATFTIVSLSAFFARNRAVLGTLTVTYLVIAVYAYVVLAPAAY